MLDQEDEGTRIGVWVALSVVFVVIVGLLGGLVLRQLHGRLVPLAAGVVGTVGAESFIDAPLSGDVVGAIYFALGQAKLPDNSEPVVDRLVQAVQEAPKRRIVLAGFHDASGSASVNADVAKERAKTLRAALVAAGVDVRRIVLRKPDSTLGDGSPIEARRVEVRLVE